MVHAHEMHLAQLNIANHHRGAFLAGVLAAALFTKSASADETPAPASAKSASAEQPPAPVGAYPSDVPKDWNAGGRRAVELDLFAGPSYSSVHYGGLAVRALLVDRRAAVSSFGTKWQVFASGGFYGLGQDAINFEGIARAQFQVGYYSVAGLKDGMGPHAMLDVVALNADAVGGVQGLYSYTPALEMGLHGRNGTTSTSWSFSLTPGVSFNYVTGALDKLDDAGQVSHYFFAPYLRSSASIDLFVSQTIFLRAGGNASDTFDSLGASGHRNIVVATAYTFLKLGPFLYTGPQLDYTSYELKADFTSGRYVSTPPEYRVSWLVGGAL